MILSVEHKRIEPDVVVMEMHGRIDEQRQPENRVGRVDSLMMCYAKLKKVGGALCLAGVQEMVEEALATTSVSKIVPWYSAAAHCCWGFPSA